MTSNVERPAPVRTMTDREPRVARMVLDAQYALDDVIAELLRAELARDALVRVEFSTAPWAWSTDAAVVAARQARLAEARHRRLHELALIAGPRAAQVTVSMQRRWRRPTSPMNLTTLLPAAPSTQGHRR